MPDVSLDSETKSAPFHTRRIGKYLGAEITGIDLTKVQDKETVAALILAHAENGVIVLPDQEIDSEDLKRFGRYFGELSVHPFSTNMEEAPELIVYDNKEGNPPPQTDVWHSDEAFRECPPMGTVLSSKIIPEIGGDTCFCSQEAAYEGLSDHMQNFIDGLEALHDFIPFKKLFPDTPEGRKSLYEWEEKIRPVAHPVVRVHPVTGKKALFVNPWKFTVRIKGMHERESRELLEKLGNTVHTLEYQYRHNWVPNTVVMWDNRSVMHAAVHDYYPQQRKLERVTIEGDRPVGTGVSIDEDALYRRKIPWIMDFKDRPKRKFERD